jgi:CRP/FNR family transcriptional regulator, cyclic AMP receptor protein
MDEQLLSALPVVNIAAGKILITEGEPLAGLYFLVSGEVEVLKGGVLVAEVFEPGATFGEMSFLLGTNPTATVRAITDSTFRHAAEPREFLGRNPEVMLHLAGVLARRVDSLNRYLVEIKNQFRDRADHLGMIDQILDSLMHKHPRHVPRRAAGD